MRRAQRLDAEVEILRQLLVLLVEALNPLIPLDARPELAERRRRAQVGIVEQLFRDAALRTRE